MHQRPIRSRSNQAEGHTNSGSYFPKEMATFVELVEYQSTLQTLIIKILPNFGRLARAKRTAGTVNNRLKSLQLYWDSCRENHAKVCALADAELRSSHEYFAKDKFLMINDAYEETHDSLSDMLEALRPSNSNCSLTESPSVMNASHIVHLPRIDVPKFFGDYTKWENFRDMFESLVTSRVDLSNVQKLHYLKATLTDDASCVLSNVLVTEANYEAAWELLRKRFDNTRVIVNVHLQALVNIPCVTSQSVPELRTLRDKTQEAYTALLNLKHPVKQWEDLLVFLTVSKLDKTIRRDWEISLGDGTEIPTYAELDKFVSSRIRALEAFSLPSLNVSRSESKRANKANPIKIHQASSNNN